MSPKFLLTDLRALYHALASFVSSFTRSSLLINEFTVFDDHLLMSYWLRALENGRDTSSFLLRSCRKRLRVADGVCAKSIPLKNVSGDIFYSQATRWWADECHRKQDALEQFCSSWTILFSLVSSFLIGSDDKISARVRSWLSLNEAVIERSATALAIKKSMCCVTWENDSRRKSWTR